MAKLEKAADEELRMLMKSGPSATEMANAKTAILARFTRIVERVGGFGGKSDLLAACQTYTGNPHCKEPALGKPESLKLPPMQKATLSNGLNVVLAERHAAPVVNFSMMVDGGYASDAPATRGTASLALRMLEEGTQKRDAARISEEFESLGANFSATTNLDTSIVQVNVLKATMQQGLEVFSDILLNPAFSQKEIDRLKQDRLAAIGREKTNANAMATRVIPALLYGKDHPYAGAMSGSGTEAAVSKLTRDDLVNYHRSWFKPNNATLLVVGDTTMAELKPMLEKAFGGWKAGDVPKKNLATVAATPKRVVYLMDKPGALQSVIYGVQLAPPRNSPDALPLQLVNNVFGGTFSSRINMNLREDKHWSYGVNARMPAALGQRLYMSSSPVQTDKTRESLQELVQEYSNIAGAKPITAAELQFAQNNETLGLPGSFETAQQLSTAYSTILQYKLPEDYYNTFTNKVLALTPEQANALAARTVTPNQLVWVVVGDMAKVESGIRDMKLGEVIKIDADGNPVK